MSKSWRPAVYKWLIFSLLSSQTHLSMLLYEWSLIRLVSKWCAIEALFHYLIKLQSVMDKSKVAMHLVCVFWWSELLTYYNLFYIVWCKGNGFGFVCHHLRNNAPFSFFWIDSTYYPFSSCTPIPWYEAFYLINTYNIRIFYIYLCKKDHKIRFNHKWLLWYRVHSTGNYIAPLASGATKEGVRPHEAATNRVLSCICHFRPVAGNFPPIMRVVVGSTKP
jgi:hypothetical protein